MQTENQGEIEIFAVLAVLFKHKLAIIAIMLMCGILGFAVIQFKRPNFKSENVFIVTATSRETPLEQWSMLAEQFGFKMSKTEDPLLTMLERVLTSEQFYRGFVGMSVNPAHPEDSSLVRLLKLDDVPPEKRSKEITARLVRLIKYVPNKDNSFSIIVKTKIPSLSVFLANEAAAHLNQFFLSRAKVELDRKIAFLSGELVQNRRELDSLSGRLRSFLESNKDFSSPLLNFRYKGLSQDLMVANEKYMLTMKAHQSLKISVSQPEYFFESITPAEEAGPPSWKDKLKWTVIALGAGFFLACAGVIFFQWLLKVSWKRPETA